METSKQSETITLSIVELEQRERHFIAWVGAQDEGLALPIPLTEAGWEIVRARLHPDKSTPTPRTGIAKRLADDPGRATFRFILKDDQLLTSIQCTNSLSQFNNSYTANSTRALPWAVQVRARLRTRPEVLQSAGRQYLPERLKESERRQAVLDVLIDRALKRDDRAAFERHSQAVRSIDD